MAADETTEKDAPEEVSPTETEEETIQLDLVDLIDEVRVLAVQALDECKELRAIITEEALDEAADDADNEGIDPEDLQIEDLIA